MTEAWGMTLNAKLRVIPLANDPLTTCAEVKESIEDAKDLYRRILEITDRIDFRIDTLPSLKPAHQKKVIEAIREDQQKIYQLLDALDRVELESFHELDRWIDGRWPLSPQQIFKSQWNKQWKVKSVSFVPKRLRVAHFVAEYSEIGLPPVEGLELGIQEGGESEMEPRFHVRWKSSPARMCGQNLTAEIEGEVQVAVSAGEGGSADRTLTALLEFSAKF